MLPDPTDGMVSVRPALRGPVNRAGPGRTNAPLLAVLTHSAHQGSKAPGGVFVAGPAHGTSAVSEDGARAADGFAEYRMFAAWRWAWFGRCRTACPVLQK